MSEYSVDFSTWMGLLFIIIFIGYVMERIENLHSIHCQWYYIVVVLNFEYSELSWANATMARI